MSKKSNNYSKRRGGSRYSTNEQFNKEVGQRLYGNSAGRHDQLPNEGTLPRVAAASANNAPRGVVDEVNRQGGRNRAAWSDRGGLTLKQYRGNELAEAFGVDKKDVQVKGRNGSWRGATAG